MRDDEVLRMLKVPPRLASQIETSQQAFALVVSSVAAEWREGLIQAMELVAEAMKDKLASLPRPRESPRAREEFWNKWSVVCTADDLSGTSQSTSRSSERRRRARSTRQDVSIKRVKGYIRGVVSGFLRERPATAVRIFIEGT